MRLPDLVLCAGLLVFAFWVTVSLESLRRRLARLESRPYLRPATPAEQKAADRKLNAEQARKVVEAITPKGACGLTECRIQTPHSHVEALVRQVRS